MEKVINKKITVEYYKVKGLVNKDDGYTEDSLDISPLFERLSKYDIKDRIINYAGEKLILKEVCFEDGMWRLVFYKTTNSAVPLITDSNGNITQKIDLDDEENIIQPICLVYNPKNRVIAMQRNVYAVGTKGIEEFLNHFGYAGAIMLRAIVLTEEKEKKINRNMVKKLSVTVHKNKKNQFIKPKQRDTNISKMLDNAIDSGSAIINIDISMGNNKELLKIQEEDFKYIEELINNSDVKKFEIGSILDEEVAMQTTDLINNRLKDIVTITFAKGQTLPLDSLVFEMTSKLKSKKIL